MNITLTPDLEELVNNKVESGAFPCADEVIRAGLRLLREQDAVFQVRRADLQRELDKGTAQYESGDVTTFTSAKEMMDDIVAKGRKILAERKAANP